jgi:hypothetical protein
MKSSIKAGEILMGNFFDLSNDVIPFSYCQGVNLTFLKRSHSI